MSNGLVGLENLDVFAALAEFGFPAECVDLVAHLVEDVPPRQELGHLGEAREAEVHEDGEEEAHLRREVVVAQVPEEEAAAEAHREGLRGLELLLLLGRVHQGADLLLGAPLLLVLFCLASPSPFFSLLMPTSISHLPLLPISL